MSFSDQFFFQPFDRTLLFPCFDLFLAPIASSWITAKVAVPPIGHAFKKRRAATTSAFSCGLLGCFIYRFDFVAIDRFTFKSLRGAAYRQLLHSNTFFQPDPHPKLIVLTYVNYRYLPTARAIHRF